MKRFKIMTAGALLGTMLVTSACDEGLADINEDPNAPQDVTVQSLLPAALLRSTEFGTQNTWFTLEFSGIFVQHWGKIQYTDEDRYSLRDQTINNFWNSMYAGPLKDWQIIVDKGTEAYDAGDVARGGTHRGVGLIGKTYVGSIMTDIWGDIPYSDALGAGTEDHTIQPVYDPQEEIYTRMLADLATAADLLEPGAPGIGGEDLLFGGDLEAWERFANSLRLRLAMRISNVAEGVAQPIVEELAAGDLITSNDQNATFRYAASPPYQNPYYENAAGGLGGGGTRDDHAASHTLIGILGALDDPRIELYANPAAEPNTSFDAEWCGGAGQLPCHVEYDGEVYRGVRNGLLVSSVPSLATISRIGSYWRAQPDTPQPLLTAAEVHFLLAEAALRGFAVGGTPAGHYEAGVRAAFDMYDGARGFDFGTAVQNAYLAQPEVALTGDFEGDLEKILTQKWLALYSMPWEAYAEYRRTGYPDELVPSEDGRYPYVPGRIPYPSDEQSVNASNLSAAVGRQETDGTYQGTVWWDPEAPEGM